jgi:hypothetical protein
MWIAILIQLASSELSKPLPASPRANVTVRIERATKANEQTWASSPTFRRREIAIVNKDGSKSRLRLIEHE